MGTVLQAAPVDAADVKLAAQQPAELDRAGRAADQHDLGAIARRPHGRDQHRRIAGCAEHALRTAAGQVAVRRDRIIGGRVDGVRAAAPARKRQPLRVEIDGDDGVAPEIMGLYGTSTRSEVSTRAWSFGTVASGGRRVDFEMLRRTITYCRSGLTWISEPQQDMTAGLSYCIPPPRRRRHQPSLVRRPSRHGRPSSAWPSTCGRWRAQRSGSARWYSLAPLKVQLTSGDGWERGNGRSK